VMGKWSVVLILFIVVASVAGRRVKLIPADPVEDGSNKITYNSCSFYAATSDLQTQNIVNTISDECHTLLGATPDSVAVNDDSYPYKMCLMASNATFGSLDPEDDESSVDKDSFNNTTNQNVSHSFSLTGQYSNSLTVQTTSTVSFSASVQFTIDLPTLFSGKFAFNASYSSSKTTIQSSSIKETYTSSTTLTCLPDCEYSATLNVQSLIYKATVDVPICLSGYAKCSYNSKVNGHYWWYVLIDDFIEDSSRCQDQNGLLASAVSVDSATTLSKTCY